MYDSAQVSVGLGARLPASTSRDQVSVRQVSRVRSFLKSVVYWGRGYGGEAQWKVVKRRGDEAFVGSSVSLAGLAAHLPEIWPAAELEPEHQGAVGHCVHIFALCQEEDTQRNEIFIVILSWMSNKTGNKALSRGHLRYCSHNIYSPKSIFS